MKKKWIYIGVGVAVLTAAYLINLQRKFRDADTPVEADETKSLLIMEIISLTKEPDTPAVRSKYSSMSVAQLKLILEGLARPSDGDGPDPADTTGGGMTF